MTLDAQNKITLDLDQFLDTHVRDTQAANAEPHKQAPVLTITHFADPYCWWSWGVEPVLSRLREVYGRQIKIDYKMGGMAQSIADWQEHAGVTSSTVSDWIASSIELSQNPVDVEFIRKTGVTSSWPAALAFNSAKMLDAKLSDRYLRRLIEALQIEARPATAETFKAVAEEVGLDGNKVLFGAHSDDVISEFAGQRIAMHQAGVNFLSSVIEADGERRVVADSFSAADYEKVIDELIPGLAKREPADILEYLEKLPGHLVSTKEISEVFQISSEIAREKLTRLEEANAISAAEFGMKNLWSYRSYEGPAYPQDVVKTSHIEPEVRINGGVGDDLETVVKTAVRSLYGEVADVPEGDFHFPVGEVAASAVGYPSAKLKELPDTAVESFAGVGFPFGANVIETGDKVLDIGSGSGTDVLYAANEVGSTGVVIGVETTRKMAVKARQNITDAGVDHAYILDGDATELPVDDESIDVVTSNGVLNLVVDKQKAFSEMFRVTKPGGWLQIADIISETSVAAVCGINPQLWADCVGGAATEKEFVDYMSDAGYIDIEVIRTDDYFSLSNSEATRKLTATFGAESRVFRARKS